MHASPDVVAEWLQFTGIVLVPSVPSDGGHGDQGGHAIGDKRAPDPGVAPTAAEQVVEQVVRRYADRAGAVARAKSFDRPIGPLLETHSRGD